MLVRVISRVEVVDFLQARDGLRVALFDVDRALDDADIARARIGFRAIHEPIERPDDIIGGHRAAVMENRILAELVRMDQPVGRDGNIRCQLQHGLVVDGIPIVQRAVDRLGVDFVLSAV